MWDTEIKFHIQKLTRVSDRMVGLQGIFWKRTSCPNVLIVTTMNYTLLSEAIIIVCLECLIICSDYRFAILSTVCPSLAGLGRAHKS